MPSLPKPRFGRSTRARGDVPSRPAEPETPNVQTVETDGLRWIHIERPRASDRAWLEEHFDFHPLDYEDVFSRNQRAKIDEYDGYLFIVLHFPRFDKHVGRLNAAELDLFVGRDFVITLPNEPLQPVDYLFERCRSNPEFRDQVFSKGNKLERLEQDIFEGRSKEIVRDLSNVKQEIINFRKVIRPQRAVIGDLERTKARYIAEDLDLYFDDINDASERIWQMLEGYKETAEALEETNESVLTHQLNDILRVLTVLTVIFLPLTLVAGIFGMNTGVPGQGQLEAFWVVVGVMLVMLVGMLAFARRRGWL
jgi:magnesium transporter